jgi:hypothetical protein
MCWTFGIAIIKNFMIFLEKHHTLTKGEGVNALPIKHYIACEKKMMHWDLNDPIAKN